MTYKIIKFDENTGMATVKFDNSTTPVAIKLPIQDSQFLTGTELDFYIYGFRPAETVYENVSGIGNISEIQALIQEDPTPTMSDIEVSSLIREKRNNLLFKTDYTQLLDSPLSTELKEKFAVYRQQLRDITEQETFPKNISWPTNPTDFVTPVVTIGSDIPPTV